MAVTVKEKPKAAEEQTKTKKKRIGTYWIFVIVFTAVIVIINIAAFEFRSLSNFYADHIFGFAAETTGRLSGIFPFSLGEVLITAGIILVVAAIVISILLIFLRRKKRFVRFACRYLESILVIALAVVMLYTLNCSILYCSSKLRFSNGAREFDIEQLENVRNYVVNECNTLSNEMERSDNGTMIFSGNSDEAAAKALHGISEQFPRLKGYYPHAKEMCGSYFMYKAHIIGVYFPFSMEANYSKYVSDSYLPHVTAHEYAHLKGYIYESEANFMSFIACINSENKAVKYSGYLCVLSFIDDDYRNSVPEDRYDAQVQISDLVRYDNSCYDNQTWEYLQKLDEEKPQPKAAEIAENVSDRMMDSYMEAFDYTPNYNEVTLLMMQYYNEYGGFDTVS